MKPFSIIIAVLGVALLVGTASYLAYTYAKKDVPAQTETVVLTPEEATAAFSIEKNDYTVTRTYYELPAEIYFSIVQKIGTNATKVQVVTEYLGNKEFYISKHVAEEIGSVPIKGPDSANVQSVTIGVKLKDPAPIEAPVVPAENHPKQSEK